MKDTRRADPNAEGRRGAEDAEPREDAAVFTVERVGGGRRGRPPMAAIGLILGIAGLVSAGLLGNTLRPAATPEGEEVALGVPDASARPESRRWIEGPDAPVETPDGRRGRGAQSPLLALDVELGKNAVLVHADVYTRGAIVVIVTLADGNDRSIQVRSVDMPGGSTAFRLGGNERFDLVFDRPDADSIEIAYVDANAYDRTGKIIASARSRIGQFVIEAPIRYRL